VSHHPFCNYFANPVVGCKMCARLNAQYPDVPVDPSDWVKENFPDAVEIAPVTNSASSLYTDSSVGSERAESKLVSFEHHGNNIRFTALMPDGDELNCELDVDKLVSMLQIQGTVWFDDFVRAFALMTVRAIGESQQLHQHPG
jgi:hypothetical protein